MAATKRKGFKAMDESELIARYFAPLATAPGADGLRDDAALIAVSEGHELVVTTDAIVEGVHFFKDDPPDTLARKALRVNLSDLAAKGAKPCGFVLTLALPRADENWLAAFAQGLKEDSTAFACPLLGGDTVKTPGPLTISVTAFGEVPQGKIVRRRGARAGDLVVVTGTIGDAALGLRLMQGNVSGEIVAAHREALIARYRVPQPRVGVAPCVQHYFSAAMDVSDGLAGDLARLCKASDVTALIRAPQVPLSEAAHAMRDVAGESWLQWVLAGGDDYEVLGTLAPNDWPAACACAQDAGIVLTRIGTIEAGPFTPPRFVDPAGARLMIAPAPFSHF